MILAAVAVLTSIFVVQATLVYAASNEKIPLVQHYEQFPDQEISGFCNVKLDDQGNLQWQIKISGLEPDTRGHFDLGHWAGEEDVPYTADEDGNADSGKQLVSEEDLLHSIFTQFAACHVYVNVDGHYDFPGIASAKINVI